MLHYPVNSDDLDMDPDNWDSDLYWDAEFNSLEKCIKAIQSFGFHDESEYLDIYDAIETASPGWFVTIPEKIMDMARPPFGEYTDIREDVWEHDQRVYLSTALRYWLSYEVESIENEERQLIADWIQRTTPMNWRH